uniref:Uncharacterized protein n=1 Tax=Populus davidiana TaxID=266767 RepID=A0A6M2EC25_9ROSI
MPLTSPVKNRSRPPLSSPVGLSIFLEKERTNQTGLHRNPPQQQSISFIANRQLVQTESEPPVATRHSGAHRSQFCPPPATPSIFNHLDNNTQRRRGTHKKKGLTEEDSRKQI